MENCIGYVDIALPEGITLRIVPLSHDIIRIKLSKNGEFPESIMEKYGIVRKSWSTPDFSVEQSNDTTLIKTGCMELIVSKTNGEIAMRGKDGDVLIDSILPRHAVLNSLDEKVYLQMIGELKEYHVVKDRQVGAILGANEAFDTSVPNMPHDSSEGFGCSIAVRSQDRLYGLGAASAYHLERKGRAYRNWASYFLPTESIMKEDQIPVERTEGPIPLLMSNRGWGVFVNTTWLHYFDVCRYDPNKVFFFGEHGDLDFFLMGGDNLSGLIQLNSEITGRPSMMPLFAYGLTYMSNVCETEVDLLNDALKFREQGIPCDIIEIEPQWMAKVMDFSHEKEWDSTNRFYMPEWLTRQEGMIGALDRMGYKLMLWLCCDDDLTIEEERQISHAEGRGCPDRQPESWFDHLKRFVDKGAAAFKIDPSILIRPHITREYFNGKSDLEMHNLTQTLILKQMKLGYEKHTRRRSMTHYCGAYAGVQRWGASTMGDSGGESKALSWMLNYALCGHSNTACDMKPIPIYDVDIDGAGIHLGFLSPWSDLCNWAYCFQPWFLGKKLSSMFSDYARLKQRLMPYIYSFAHVANRTGIPIMRPMPLAYPADERLEDNTRQYMLGDSLLVTAFTEQLVLPEGHWLDYWTGKEYTGPLDTKYNIPENRGGGLFIKQGAIIPYWPEISHLDEQKVEDITLFVYPGTDSSFSLYEDDGISLEYLDGMIAQTEISCRKDESQIAISISPRRGSYTGIPERRSYTFRICCDCPKEVLVNNRAIPKLYEGERYTNTSRLGSDRYQTVASIVHEYGWEYDYRDRIVSFHMGGNVAGGCDISIIADDK